MYLALLNACSVNSKNTHIWEKIIFYINVKKSLTLFFEPNRKQIPNFLSKFLEIKMISTKSVTGYNHRRFDMGHLVADFSLMIYAESH